MQTLEECIDIELAEGGGAGLTAELEGLVKENPFRERLRGQLMLALYRSGRQTDALKAYLDARRALVDELGIEPGPGLQRLYRSILRQEVSLERAPPPHAGEDQLDAAVEAALAGRLVVVVGAGVDRAAADGPVPGPAELLARLVKVFGCPPEHARDLAHVAEYVALTRGVGPLYDEIHELYERESAPGPVHEALAGVERSLKERGSPHLLVVTTSFHELLEHAFRAAGCEADVVSFLAVGRHQGKFLHAGADGPPVVVDAPYAYTDVALERSQRRPEDPRWDRPEARARMGELRDQRGRLHRQLPRRRPGCCAPGHPRCTAAAEPLPVPRLSAAGVEPQGVPPPGMGP